MQILSNKKQVSLGNLILLSYFVTFSATKNYNTKNGYIFIPEYT